LAWTWSTIAMTAVMQLTYTAVMSRLLEPSDFGLVAAALIGLRFVTHFSKFGLGSAVVQRPTLTDAEAAIALRLALLLGLFSAAVTVLCSPLLALAINRPAAGSIMRLMSIAVFVGAVTGVLEGLVRRRMKFRQLGISQVVSFAIGYLGVGITLAELGWGAHSLVAATVTQGVVQCVLLAYVARVPWRAHHDRAVAKQLMNFGGTVAVTGFTEFLSSSADTLAVGRWLGTAPLGQYTRATMLVALPVEWMATATSRVLGPAFSSVQDDDDRFARGFLRATGAQYLVVLLPVAMAIAAAPVLVDVVLGSGWGVAASVLPMVATAHGISMLTNVPAVAAEAKGIVTVKLVIQIVALIALLSGLAAVVRAGATVHRFAAVWLASELLRHMLYWILVVPRLGVRRRQLAVRLAAAIASAAVAAAPVFTLVRVLDESSVVFVALAAIVGVALAAGVALTTPVSQVLLDDLRAVRASVRAASD
jgi:O-antigen/teichoic acid export membrane protein